MREVALTTIDNPYDPIDDFEHWLAYDQEKRYFTLEYIDRVAYTSDSFPDEYNEKEIERAIDEICYFNILGIYKKIVKDS